MGLIAVQETAELFRQKDSSLTERDREFVAQFAFRTDDKELTDKLVEELETDGADRNAVCRKYQALAGFRPDWIKRIENLLISIEMYRKQEERAVKTLSALLAACGISMSGEELRRADIAEEQCSRQISPAMSKKETSL